MSLWVIIDIIAQDVMFRLNNKFLKIVADLLLYLWKLYRSEFSSYNI